MAKQIDDIIGGFDPAQSYEFADNECCGNIYRKLIVPDPKDTSKLVGDLAEKWEVSKDGLTFDFAIRKGVLFESGKPLTAEDVAFSLQRVVKLNKTPGFILTQFGWNADNVEKMITANGENSLQLMLPAVQASSFVLYCLSATCGCIVEKADCAGAPDQRRPGQCLDAIAYRGHRPFSWWTGRRRITSFWKPIRMPR